MCVVDAVAEASDVSPMQVTPRLSDAIDPDALDRLFSSGRDDREPRQGCAKFEMGAWHVQVDWGENCVRIFDATES